MTEPAVFSRWLPSAWLPIFAATMILMTFQAQATVTQTPVMTVPIGFIELIQARPPLMSNVIPEPQDSGLQGARLGIQDNNSSGRFIGQLHRLLEARSNNFATLLQQADAWYEQGVRLVIARLPAEQLEQLSAHFRNRSLLIFNSSAPDDGLRADQCLTNVLHTLPSRAMLTDALAQWLIAKRLNRWFFIEGKRPQDQAYGSALRRAAKRFGATLIAEKTWSFETDLRRTAQAELPLFTQARGYDVVVVADELGDFGEYVLYNTWLPRPVAGTQGLKPTAWHAVVEQWGAAQLQRRFQKLAKRSMTAADYGAWLAARSIGEGITQRGSSDASQLHQFLLSRDFQLGGFKGRKLSYREWSGQLRQPIPLIHPRALVSQSPQEGYLHPLTDLDTLGFDRAESQCRASEHIIGATS